MRAVASGFSVVRVSAQDAAESISVLIADDQALVRAGFRAILDAHLGSASAARPETGATPWTWHASGGRTSC